MLDYDEEPNGGIRVSCHRYGTGLDTIMGHLRKGGEDEDYWHFFPSPECVLSAGACKRLGNKLAELNRGLQEEA